MAEKTTGEMQATLGLTGLTMNAMALIAPGAFLWLTFVRASHRRSDSSCDVDRHRCSHFCSVWRQRYVMRKWRSYIQARAVRITLRSNPS